MSEEKPAKFFIRARYPGMKPAESEIFTRFLMETDLTFTKIEYNVRVGLGYDPGPQYPENIRKMMIQLTQLRIDAVGHRKDEIWLFEVKLRAGMSAIGQLISYAEWYRAQYKPKKPIRLGVIAEYYDPNVLPIYETRGISLFLVGEKKAISKPLAIEKRKERYRILQEEKQL